MNRIFSVNQVFWILLFCVFISGCETQKEYTLNGTLFEDKWLEITGFDPSLLTGDLTIDLYIRIKKYPEHWTAIAAFYESDRKTLFNLRLKNSEQGQWFYGNGLRTMVLSWRPADMLVPGQWVRITAVRNMHNMTMSIFADSRLVASRRFQVLPRAYQASSSLQILAQGSQTLHAELAEIRIWNEALGPAFLNSVAPGSSPESSSPAPLLYLNLQGPTPLLKDFSESNSSLSLINKRGGP